MRHDGRHGGYQTGTLHAQVSQWSVCVFEGFSDLAGQSHMHIHLLSCSLSVMHLWCKQMSMQRPATCPGGHHAALTGSGAVRGRDRVACGIPAMACAWKTTGARAPTPPHSAFHRHAPWTPCMNLRTHALSHAATSQVQHCFLQCRCMCSDRMLHVAPGYHLADEPCH